MPAKITVNNNGPIRIEGEFQICDANGAIFDTTGKKAVSLCRCGQTQNAPFCDGQHKACGFTSEVKATGTA